MNADMTQTVYRSQAQLAVPPARSKRCPRCGELLFDDMDVCYGCLYDFTREPFRLPEGMLDLGLDEPSDVFGSAAAPAVATKPAARLPVEPCPEPAPVMLREPAPAAPSPAATPVREPAPALLHDPVPAPQHEPSSSVFPKASPCGRRLSLKTHELDLGFPLPDKGLALGRAEDNDIVLHESGFAEHHLVLVPRTDDVLAVGLVAGAFTCAQGSVSHDCACLREGDAISLGGVRLQLMG